MWGNLEVLAHRLIAPDDDESSSMNDDSSQTTGWEDDDAFVEEDDDATDVGREEVAPEEVEDTEKASANGHQTEENEGWDNEDLDFSSNHANTELPETTDQAQADHLQPLSPAPQTNLVLDNIIPTKEIGLDEEGNPDDSPPLSDSVEIDGWEEESDEFNFDSSHHDAAEPITVDSNPIEGNNAEADPGIHNAKPPPTTDAVPFTSISTPDRNEIETTVKDIQAQEPTEPETIFLEQQVEAVENVPVPPTVSNEINPEKVQVTPTDHGAATTNVPIPAQHFDTNFDELSLKVAECKELRSEIAKLENQLEITRGSSEEAINDLRLQHQREHDKLSSHLRQVLAQQENASHQLTQTQRTLQTAESQLNVLKDHRNPTLVVVEQHERDLRQQYDLIDSKTQRIRELEQQCRKLELHQERVVAKALQQQQLANQESEQMATELLSVAEERDFLQDSLQETVAAVKELQQQVESHDPGLANSLADARAEVGFVQETLKESKVENGALRQQLDDMRYESETLKADLKAVKLENAALKADRELGADLSDLAEENESLRQEVERLRGSLQEERAEWGSKLMAAGEESQAVVLQWQEAYQAELDKKDRLESEYMALQTQLQEREQSWTIDEKKMADAVQEARTTVETLTSQLSEKETELQEYNELKLELVALHEQNNLLLEQLEESKTRNSADVVISDRSFSVPAADSIAELEALRKENKQLGTNLEIAKDLLRSSAEETEAALEKLAQEKNVEIEDLANQLAQKGSIESVDRETDALIQQVAAAHMEQKELQNRLSSSQSDIVSLEARLESVRAESLQGVMSANTAKEELQEKFHILQLESSELKLTLEAANSQIETHIARNTELSTELDTAKTHHKQELDRLSIVHDELKENSRDLELEVNELKAELKSAKSDLKEADRGDELDRLAAERSELASKLESRERDLISANNALGVLQREKAESDMKQVATEKRLEAALQKQQSKDAEMNNIRDAMDQLKSKHEQEISAAVQATQNDRDELQLRVDQLSSEAVQLQGDLTRAKSAFDEAEEAHTTAIDDLQLEKDLIEDDLEELRTEKAALDQKLKSTFAELVEANTQAGKSREECDALRLQLAQKDTLISQIREQAKEEQSGSQFEISRLQRDLDTTIRQHGEASGFAQNKVAALQQTVDQRDSELVQLREELSVVNADLQEAEELRISDVEAIQLEKDLQEAELADLQVECSSLEKKVEVLQTQLTEASESKNTLAELQRQLVVAKSEIANRQNVSENSVSQDQQVQLLQRSATSLKAENQSLEAQLELALAELKEQVSCREQETTQMTSDVVRLTQEVNRLESELESREKSVDREHTSEVDRLVEELDSLRATKVIDEEARRNLEEKLLCLNSEIEKLQANSQDLEDLQLEKSLLEDDFHELQSENQDLQRQVSELGRGKELLQSQVSSLATELQEAQELKSSMHSGELERLQGALKALKAEYDCVSTDLMSREMDIDELKEQLEMKAAAESFDTESLRSSLADAEVEISNLKKSGHQLMARLQELQLEKPIFEETIEKLEDELKAKEFELADLSKGVNEASDEAKSQKKTTVTADAMEELRTELTESKRMYEEAETQRQEAVGHLAALGQSLKRAEEKARENLTIQAKLDLLEDQCVGLQDQIEAVTMQRDDALLKSETLQSAHAEAVNVLAGENDSMKQQNEMLVTEVARYRELETYASDQLEKAEAAARAESFAQKNRLQELEVEIENSQERVELLKKEVHSLQEQIAWADHQRHQEVESLEERTEHERTQDFERAKELESELQSLRLRLKNAEDEKAKLKESATNGDHVPQQLIEQYKKRMDELEAEARQLRTESSNLSAVVEERNSLQSELQSQRDRTEQTFAELKSLKEENEELLVQFGLIKQQIDASQEYIECLQSEIEKLGGTEVLQSAVHTAWSSASAQIQASGLIRDKSETPISAECQANEDSLTRFADRINELETEIQEKVTVVKDLHDTIASLQDRANLANEMKENIETKEKEIEGLQLETEILGKQLVETQGELQSLLSSHEGQSVLRNQQELAILRTHVVSLAQALERAENSRADSIGRLVMERETHAKNLRLMTENVKRFYSTVTHGDA